MPPRSWNPKGAWVLRAISSLLVVDDVHGHRLPPRASTSPRKPHARDPYEFSDRLLEGPARLLVSATEHNRSHVSLEHSKQLVFEFFEVLVV